MLKKSASEKVNCPVSPLCLPNARPPKHGEGAARCPSRSQNAHGKREGMEPDDLLFSRNARPQKALVGRAQRMIIQPPSLNRYQMRFEGSHRTSLDRCRENNTGAIPGREKQARLDGAGEGGLDDLLCSCNARSQKTLVGHAQWETI